MMDAKTRNKLEQVITEYETQVAQKYVLEDEWSHEILLVVTARDDVYEILKNCNINSEHALIARINEADRVWRQWARKYQNDLITSGNVPFVWSLRLSDKPKEQWWWWIDQLES